MKRWRWILGTAVALLLLSAAGAVVALRSDWFREQVRARIVAETQRASGGQASLDNFDFDWRTLTATARGFVLRGKEPAGAEPLFTVRAIELKLSVLSWLSRDIRLRSLALQQPRVQIFVYPDGTTNLPQPKIPRKQGNPLEDLMRLKIGRIELREGWFHLDHQAVPLDVRASGLDLRLAFDAANKRYRTEGSMTEVQLPGGYKPALELAGWLESRRFQFEKASARFGESNAAMSGFVVFSPFEVQADYEAKVKLADVPQLGIPIGRAAVSGKFNLAGGQFGSSGTVTASGVSFTAGGVHIEQASLAGAFDLRRDDLELRNLSFSTAFGAGTGEARIRNWHSLEVSAELSNVDVERVQQVLLEKPYAWSGTAKGPVTLTASLAKSGVTVEQMTAAVEVEPAEGVAPVGGSISLAWSRQEGLLRLDGTSLSTPASRFNVRGALGQELDVSLFTTSIRDIEPVVALFSRDEDFSLPLTIDNGEAKIDAKVRGPLDRPRIAGTLHLKNARVDEAPFDRFDARFDVSADRLVVSDLALKQQDATMNGRLSAQLRNWTADWASPIDLALRVENAEVQRILGLFRVKSPLTGVFDGTIQARGPAGAPALNVRISGAGASLGREVVRKASLALATEPDGAFQGKLVLDSMTGDLSGHLRHADGDFQNGSARVNVKTSSIRTSELESLQSAGMRIDGVLSGDLTFDMSYSPAGIKWNGVDGSLTTPEIRINDRRLERLELRSVSRSGAVDLNMKCAIRGESDQLFNASARLNLAGDPILEGQATFPRMSFAFLRGISTPPSQPAAAAQAPLPVRGFVEGEARYSMNLNQPNSAKASLTISRLQLRPRESQVLETQIDPSELVLSNSSPILVDIDSERATIRSSSFTARETKLALSGTVGLKENASLNLRVTGGVNLALLSTFRPEVEANGRADLDANIRGTPADPSLSGRMTISGASFFLKDLPNGIENANGTVFFEKNRANIEKLSGQTGGGEFLITGFLGINEGEFNYRLNARGKGIRIRYPEGVSTTADASLDLIGAPSRTLLSGTVTVLKSGIIGGGDFGEVVGGTANPITPPATRNEFLRNLQFDVKIRTAADATLASSYTEGLETEANLQLRGSPSKPVLLGNVQVNQGTIRFFGNRYTISRGELLFYNTAVVQPAIDLDLETRIRGVTVYINVSGPLARLNVNYRSEPPLQSNEILALLTVGRAPAATESSLQASSTIRNQNVLENTSSNSLLGGALSAGISNRVERFFGASRIKIDPQATGVDNVAQARLSIEQSLSRDVTVTFVTNLSRTQEQIVRVEWDVSRQWQVIAVRDENGIFAVDFIYRTRFK